MPREQITFDRVPAILGSVEIDDASGERIISETPVPNAPTFHIAWYGGPDAGGWVQTMFRVDRAWLEQVLAANDDTVVEMYSEVLERTEINKAVRVFRRARDAAYGRDE